jgi:hypothetical protein
MMPKSVNIPNPIGRILKAGPNGWERAGEANAMLAAVKAELLIKSLLFIIKILIF